MKGYDQKHLETPPDRLAERAFTQSIVISVLSIALCLATLCSVTWAWFRDGVSSESNQIKAANNQVSATVEASDPAADTYAWQTRQSPADGTYYLAAYQIYQITLTQTGTTEHAYCVLKTGDRLYYTDQIPSSGQSVTLSLQFTTDTEIEITSFWGSYNQFSGISVPILQSNQHYVDMQESAPVSPPETTAAEEPTAEPEEITIEPEETTAESKEITIEPEETTAVPEETTAAQATEQNEQNG